MSVKATRASFRITEELMKHGKPFSDGEIVKKCLIIAAEESTPDHKSFFAAIPLTRNTVADRADNIGDELEANLKNLCKRFVAFSIALDESTDIVDTAQLAVFIRGVTVELEVYEEFLCTVPLLGTTTGEDIFMAVKSVFLRFDLSSYVYDRTGTPPSKTVKVLEHPPKQRTDRVSQATRRTRPPEPHTGPGHPEFRATYQTRPPGPASGTRP